MKKTFKRAMALVSAVLIVLSIFAVSAFAGTVDGDCQGTTTTFDKYLTMKKEANVPNVDFNYSITSGTAKEAVRDEESNIVIQPAVYAGNDSEKVEGEPTITELVSFAVGDTTYDTTQSGDTVILENGHKYAKKTITLDFTEVTFKQPGIYRYVITESGINDGVINDANPNRYCDVYVHQNLETEAHKLEIVGYSIHEGDEVIYNSFNDWNEFAASEDIDELKDNGFQNDYETTNLSIKKIISGNQGWKNNYFKFVLKIKNADAGTRYDVDLSNTSYAANKNTTSGIKVDGDKYYLIADDNGVCEYTFYLSNKGGNKESIEVFGLTAETMYFVEEDCQDYTPSWTLKNASVSHGADCKLNDFVKVGGTKNNLEFFNARNGVVPTAYIVEVAPYVVLAVTALAGAVLFAVNKKKKEVTE